MQSWGGEGGRHPDHPTGCHISTRTAGIVAEEEMGATRATAFSCVLGVCFLVEDLEGLNGFLQFPFDDTNRRHSFSPLARVLPMPCACAGCATARRSVACARRQLRGSEIKNGLGLGASVAHLLFFLCILVPCSCALQTNPKLYTR